MSSQRIDRNKFWSTFIIDPFDCKLTVASDAQRRMDNAEIVCVGDQELLLFQSLGGWILPINGIWVWISRILNVHLTVLAINSFIVRLIINCWNWIFLNHRHEGKRERDIKTTHPPPVGSRLHLQYRPAPIFLLLFLRLCTLLSFKRACKSPMDGWRAE